LVIITAQCTHILHFVKFYDHDDDVVVVVCFKWVILYVNKNMGFLSEQACLTLLMLMSDFMRVSLLLLKWQLKTINLELQVFLRPTVVRSTCMSCTK